MRLKELLSVAVAALVGVVIMAPPGLASPSPAANGAAKFANRTIDLRQNWEDAESCVVFTAERVECFANNAEANSAADAYTGKTTPQQYQGGAFDCATGWLCLYGGPNGYGRRLIFNEEKWHRLGDYGFASLVKSWRNNQLCLGDTGILGDGVGGVLTLEDCSRAAALDGYWSDVATDVHG